VSISSATITGIAAIFVAVRSLTCLVSPPRRPGEGNSSTPSPIILTFIVHFTPGLQIAYTGLDIVASPWAREVSVRRVPVWGSNTDRGCASAQDAVSRGPIS
jgi:hypothetical protein